MVGSSGHHNTKWELVCEVLWALALISLPLTSFPFLSSLTGALVSPLAILPIFILLIIWTIPLILRKGELPKETVPLIIFFSIAIIASALAFFFFIPGFKGKSMPAQELRALLTLAIGITFYLVTTSWVKSPERLHNTWKYITIGGILAVAWSCVQAFFIFRHYDFYPTWMNEIQSWLAVLSPQYSPRYGRVNGLTYEASWFAHQMVMLYLPIWMAATYKKTSAFKFRIWRISIENILLVIGVLVFFLSSPRIGLISFLLMLIYLFIGLNVSLHRGIVNYLTDQRIFLRYSSAARRRSWISASATIALLSAYAVVLVGILYFSVQRDWRLAKLVSEPPSTQESIGLVTLDETTLLKLSQRFIFMERMVYWLNGWNVFNQFPWLGVGLGNAGFFFPSLAPPMGWATFEIRNVLFYLTQLPNVKSFWFRLLAETGIIGFSVFITWIYVLFQSSRLSRRSQCTAIKTLALAGQLSILAFIGEGFSIDSFAMPYLWIMAGLIAAMGLLVRQEIQSG
ncbi:MAG: O-antigen ligase family protein [Anaerolineae bacterium]|nr:O-antigen ligase family protein [Anaerolineae bacterium]